MAFPINATGDIGIAINAITQNLTGDIIATMIMLLVFLFALALVMQIPLEFFAILILPLCITISAYQGGFVLSVVLIIFYFAAIIAQHWMFR